MTTLEIKLSLPDSLAREAPQAGILLGECVDRRLVREIVGYHIKTPPQMR